MKKILTAALILVILFTTIPSALCLTPIAYSITGQVYYVDSHTDIVFVNGDDGNIWTFYADAFSDWKVGDIVSMDFLNNGTETPTDDILISIQLILPD